MARTTKQLSGAGKDKFLRGLIASELGIPSDAAATLEEKMCSAIADVRVRRDVWDERKHIPAANPVAITPSPAESAAAPLTSADQTATDAAPFDPFSFSALAVLTKKGRAALAMQFAGIDNANHLHALAAAQHLTVDANLTELGPLREALVTATEARLAERRAAAS